ncbi:hypothetical protein CK203_047720 [Vitis vinifera]|uniref:Uncharacterized protein n=1 Tax=Vitis vinifera TaxID=29760 RepID=A0A438H254_VITVI|nr:hypothetical protein CK203_047720 [Vitis vinifera]
MMGNPSSTTTTENSALVTTATKAMNAAIEGIQRKLKRNRNMVMGESLLKFIQGRKGRPQ